MIVDDFGPWRRAVRSILKNASDLEIIGECSDGADAVRQCGKLRPDLVLLDVQLPGLNGFVAAQQIGKVSPETKIMFFSADRSFEVVRKALRIGAGMVAKANAHRELLPMIRLIMSNESSLQFEILDPTQGPDEV